MVQKKRILYISQDTKNLPVSYYQRIKIRKRREYVTYGGLRFANKPQKRIILKAITTNNQQPSKKTII
jgi:hypothetical protein